MKSELPALLGAALLGVVIAAATIAAVVGGFIWLHTHFMR